MDGFLDGTQGIDINRTRHIIRQKGRATTRHHCLNIALEKKAIKGNGLDLALDPSIEGSFEVGQHNDFAPPSSSKTIDNNGLDFSVEEFETFNGNLEMPLISISNLERYVGEVLMRAIAERDAQIDARLTRLEEMLERILGCPDNENAQVTAAGTRGTPSRVIQLSERRPDKITIQYFKNKSTKGRQPTLKLEFHEQRFSKTNQSYYAKYQALHGYCYNDFGLSKLDSMAKLEPNIQSDSDIDRIKMVLEKLVSQGLPGGEIGGYFYNHETCEILTGAIAIVRPDMTCTLIIVLPDDVMVETVNMATSKGKHTDGYYILNKKRIEEIFFDTSNS